MNATITKTEEVTFQQVAKPIVKELTDQRDGNYFYADGTSYSVSNEEKSLFLKL